MKNFIKSKTVWGTLIAALGFLGGPEAAAVLEPVFGGTLPLWVANVLKGAGLLFALYGRFAATQQITVGPSDDTELIRLSR